MLQLHQAACFTVALYLISVVSAWNLQTTMQGQNFFNNFNFYTSNDPTHGYVDYVDSSTAFSKGYASAGSSNVYIGCDHTNVASGRGRQSVRLQSRATWNYGLFIWQGTHMPVGCGTWPAYWLVGPNWPSGGECDIIEGVDEQTNDATTLHTNSGCDMSSAPKNYTGRTGNTNCYDPQSNTGCGITSPTSNSYGNGLNNAGGGVYAVEWTDDGFRMWFWTMHDVPSNAQGNNPSPDSWGIPYAAFPFGGWCPASHFKAMQIIINLTFCGDWDGAVFEHDCPGKGDCNSFVKNNPKEFANAYWIIDYIKVFQ